MPTYHSRYNEHNGKAICGTVVLPLKTKVRGPALPCKTGEIDVVDEAIKFYRANVLFRTFKPQGPADLTVCYLTVLITELLRFWFKSKCDQEGALKNHTKITHSQVFPLPGERSFPLNGFFTEAESQKEKDEFRAYFRQLREETASRLALKVFDHEGKPNKFWFQFQKKNFMNIRSTSSLF